MGRKIPGKKHRGVKDPLLQLAKRNERLQNKINSPPEHPDEQELPKSVIELNRLRQMVKEGKFKKKKRKKQVFKNLIDTSNFNRTGPMLPGMTQKDKPLPNIRQIEGESETSFLNRVYDATEEIIKEASIEEKYHLTINRKPDGSIEGIQSDMNYSKQLKHNFKEKKNYKERMKMKERIKDVKSKKLNKKQRLKLKKAIKENKSIEDVLEYKVDNVKFGEVVHAPPILKTTPKGSRDTNFDKPRGRTLLLNGIFSPDRS